MGVPGCDGAQRFAAEQDARRHGPPVMDGHALARRLRELAGCGELRRIAVTGYGQDSDRARSREAGFDHHLVKPIALDALIPLLSGG